jgi:hypothetical protein
MITSYKWNITSLECHPEYKNNTNVAIRANWTLTGSVEDCNIESYGSVSLENIKYSDYIEFESLTLETTIKWVEEALGDITISAIKENIANQIAEKITPKIVSPKLPWIIDSTNKTLLIEEVIQNVVELPVVEEIIQNNT